MGNKAWTQALDWSGKNSYNAEADHAWYYAVNSANASSTSEGGMARTAKASSGEGSLTFLQVYEAGHMVPMDQPAAALALLNTFLANKPFY